MLSRISLLNFKCFDRPTEIAFGPFTLLTGVNSRGKSSAIQPLLLMRQSIAKHETTRRLYLNGEYVSLGRFTDMRSIQASRSDSVEIGFRFAKQDAQLDIKYTLLPDETDESCALIGRIVIDAASSGQQYSKIQDFSDTGQSSLWKDLIPQIQDIPNTLAELAEWSTIHYISADRLGPQEYYLKHSFPDSPAVGPRGQHTASILLSAKQLVANPMMTIDTGITQTVPDQAAAWLSQLFGEAHLDVQGTDTNVILLYLSSDSSPSQLYRPTNVGFGYSYVLPVIVTALIAQPGEIVIVENPEAHLHPAAQARLVHMLARLSNSGVQVIVESHSDHVLNALRVAVAESVLPPNNLQILYFERNAGQYWQSIAIGQGGVIDLPNWPEGFFDQTEKDFARLFRG